MRKIGIAKKQNPLSEKEKALIDKLREHPRLFDRFESILEISDGEQGAIKSGDEVEALLIEEVRKLGKTSMEQWAQETEKRAGREQRENPPAAIAEKTAELVERVREGGGADLVRWAAKLPEGFFAG